MNRFSLFIVLFFLLVNSYAQNLHVKANAFIQSLDDAQRAKTLYPFDTEERYRFVYVPVDDRKGITVNELNSAQRRLLINLLNSCLSEQAVKKVNDIMQLEVLLKQLENRPPEDHHRDPGKYFVTFFGVPAANTIWGWRFEGHHIAFNFSADKQKLVAATPNFLGSNPAIVLSGAEKGKEILKEETAKGFALVQALSADELKKALISTTAPVEIITGNSRKALIDHPEGIRYNELLPAHQQMLLQLIDEYIHRYTKLFAEDMLKDIRAAGLDKLWFTWAGATDHAIGKPHYYRIQGPTIIIEYDNIQNDANHVHTTVRDLKNDFGGDELLEHYKKER